MYKVMLTEEKIKKVVCQCGRFRQKVQHHCRIVTLAMTEIIKIVVERWNFGWYSRWLKNCAYE